MATGPMAAVTVERSKESLEHPSRARNTHLFTTKPADKPKQKRAPYASVNRAVAGQKQCTKCGETKPAVLGSPLSEFTPRSIAGDGFASQCKACKRAADKVWRKQVAAKPERALTKRETRAVVTTARADHHAKHQAKNGQKLCTGCDLVLPAVIGSASCAFSNDVDAPDGLCTRCRGCRRAAKARKGMAA